MFTKRPLTTTTFFTSLPSMAWETASSAWAFTSSSAASADAAEEDVKAQALEAVSQAIEGKDVKKVVVVKGRLVNIVAK